MAGLGELLEPLLIGEATYKRLPSVKQMINQAYARGGHTWKGAAAWLGVTEVTLRRWRRGGTPSGPKIQQMREHAAEVRRTRAALPIPAVSSARIRFLFDGRDRDYPLKNLKLTEATLKACQDHLMARDYDAAGREFLAGIGDPWYRAHFTAYEAQDRAEQAAAAAGGEIQEGADVEDQWDDMSGEEYDGNAVDENSEYTFTVGSFAR